MPEGDIVRSLTDNRKYLLGPFLKSGLIGAVYPAASMDDEKIRVAVKIPAVNLSINELTRFQLEYDVMTSLAEKTGEPPLTPWIQRGENESSGGEALIMEFVSDEHMLTGKLAALEKSPLEKEILALNSALQYARLLESLHSLEITCPDRKLADINWMEGYPEGRLVVLDWNVVREGIEDVPEDLYLFGSLWYQLLTGRFPSTVVDPLDDALWRDGTISFGTRWLIDRMLLKDQPETYQSAAELKKDIQKRLDLLNRSADDMVTEANPISEDVQWQARRAQNAIEQARRYADTDRDIPLPDLAQERAALDLLDIALRKGREDVKDQRDLILQLVSDQSDRLVNHVEHAFRITQYNLGSQAVEWANQVSKKRSDPQLSLKVARWSLLINAGHQAMDEGYGLRGIRDQLADLVLEIEQGTEQTSPHRWHEIGSILDPNLTKEQIPSQSRTSSLLNSLLYETTVRGSLADARQQEFESNYDRAQASAAEALLNIEKVTAYQIELKAALPDMHKWLDALQSRAQAKKNLSILNNRLQSENPYLPYLLETTVQDMHRWIEVADQATVAATVEHLYKLAELYRMRARVERNPSFWPEVVRTAGMFWNDRAVDPQLRSQAEKYLLEAWAQAVELSDIGISESDRLASQIYEALREVR